jgi:3-(3-hydroxy-phenyl)propionate hydroxylase
VASRSRDRNVFILGDAAHLTPPFVGQGMAAGLRDAMNLTWKLAGVLSGRLREDMLDTYQKERKPHSRTMIYVAVSVGLAMTTGGRLGDFVRRAIVPALHHVPGIRAAADGVTPALRKSALVIKSAGRRELAGTVCPNPVMDSGVRLDEVIANRFALITSSPLRDEQRTDLHRRGAVVVSTAQGDPLDEWLRRARVGAAIVRPDGTVMQTGDIKSLCGVMPSFRGFHQARAEELGHTQW